MTKTKGNIDEVITSFKPPIFWKDKEIVKMQVKNWSQINTSWDNNLTLTILRLFHLIQPVFTLHYKWLVHIVFIKSISH